MIKSTNIYNDFIKEIRRQSKENEFWLLYSLGELRYNFNHEQYLRSFHFLRISEPDYDINKWGEKRFITIELLEEMVIVYPIGSIFNYKGEVELKPDVNNQFIETNNVVISNYSNYKETNPNYFYENTCLPGIPEQQIYPHFIFQGKYENNPLVLIPISVISRKFYYSSTNCIISIIYNYIKDGLNRKEFDEETALVEYNSEKVDIDTARFLGKYSLTSEKYSGLDNLKHSIRKYYKQIFNNDKNNTVAKSDIGFQLPFNFPLRAKVMGIYIDNKSKFLCFDILNAEPFIKKENVDKNKPNLVEQKREIKKYICQRFILKDISDRSSTKNKNGKKDINYTGISFKDNKLIIERAIQHNQPTNSSARLKDFTVINEHIFTEGPECIIMKREDQLNSYKLIDIINKEIEGIGTDHIHTNSNSKLRKSNIKISSDKDYLVLMNSVYHILRLKYNFEIINITVFDSNNYPFSAVPNPNGQLRFNILITKILYDKQEFYLVDAGSDIYIGVFKNLGIPFISKNDLMLSKFLKFMLWKHHFRWSNVYYNHKYSGSLSEEKKRNYDVILKTFNLQMLQPLEHIADDGTLALNLAIRINKRILENQ